MFQHLKYSHSGVLMTIAWSEVGRILLLEGVMYSDQMESIRCWANTKYAELNTMELERCQRFLHNLKETEMSNGSTCLHNPIPNMLTNVCDVRGSIRQEMLFLDLASSYIQQSGCKYIPDNFCCQSETVAKKKNGVKSAQRIVIFFNVLNLVEINFV